MNKPSHRFGESKRGETAWRLPARSRSGEGRGDSKEVSPMVIIVRKNQRNISEYSGLVPFEAGGWGEWRDSNPRSPGPQPGALTARLHPP